MDPSGVERVGHPDIDVVADVLRSCSCDPDFEHSVVAQLVFLSVPPTSASGATLYLIVKQREDTASHSRDADSPE